MNDQFAIFMLVATLLLLFTGADALKALLISRGANKSDRQIAKVNRISIWAFVAYLAAGAAYMIYRFGWDGVWQSIIGVVAILGAGALLAKFTSKSGPIQKARHERLAGRLSMVSFSILLAAVLLGGVSHYISKI